MPVSLTSLMHDWTLPTSTPGAGIWHPARKTTMIPRTKSSLRRRSGVRKAFANALSTVYLCSCSACLPSRGGPRKPNPAGTHVPHGERSSDRGSSAGGLDLLLGRGGERLDRHVDLDGDVALAEDLDRLAVADRTLGHEPVDGDLATLGEQLPEPVEVHDLELDPERVLEALELGQPHVDRHLPTLEGRGHLVAGLGALGAAAGGLALGGLTATHAGLGGLGTRSRAQVVELESHLSSLPRPSRGDGRCGPCRGSRGGPP